MADHSMLGIIVINLDPVLHLGPLQVHWYGVMYAVAFYVAYRFGVVPLAARAGVPRSTADRITTWTIVFGLVGGRLYYVLQQPNLVNDYLLHPINIIAIWQGGMAFFGAIIAGFITLTVCAWRYRINPWVALDGGVLFAVVGQPIGRIGNLINGDILGAPSSLPWATAYANPHAILQANFTMCTDPGHPGSVLCPAYVPAAAYEALATIGIGVILYLLYRRRARPGIMAITYLVLYAVSQLIVFQYRASEPTVLRGLHQAQWTAIGMLIVAVPALLYLRRRFPPPPSPEVAASETTQPSPATATPEPAPAEPTTPPHDSSSKSKTAAKRS